MAFSSTLPTLVIVLIAGCYANQENDPRLGTPCVAHHLVATYEDILNLPKQPNVLLIDVRRPEDLIATGAIPQSINIPFDSIKQELQLEAELFEGKYGRKKPPTNSLIIFSSRTGQKAEEAAHIAHKMGFKNFKIYTGSWNEYARIKGLRQE